MMANGELKQKMKVFLVTAVWMLCWELFTISDVGINAERLLKDKLEPATYINYVEENNEMMRPQGFALRLVHFLWNGKSSYEHVWPVRL